MLQFSPLDMLTPNFSYGMLRLRNLRPDDLRSGHILTSAGFENSIINHDGT
ncbi:hypothetical protein Pint_07736 [Pistacia integerrima]|uniref:Uncharacterized protein n=1 Tax=Pistacia integerrima TaxID=434235 RepID=A0ACC0XX67_9ROSI|nr:hypothetical protein Pint_07736 [Pistacia integerrima]